MQTDNEPQGKPPIDAKNAPYGHADISPLGFVPPAESEIPSIDLLGEGVEHAHEALHSFAEDEAPVFPPVNVGPANEQDQAHLQPPADHEKHEAGSERAKLDPFRSFVRSHPLASVFTAAAFGLLIARIAR